jgi:hypothetical protein
MKFACGFAGIGCVAAALLGTVSAASYDDIPEIEVYGQHFFYTNNGSQLYAQSFSGRRTYR